MWNYPPLLAVPLTMWRWRLLPWLVFVVGLSPISASGISWFLWMRYRYLRTWRSNSNLLWPQPHSYFIISQSSKMVWDSVDKETFYLTNYHYQCLLCYSSLFLESLKKNEPSLCCVWFLDSWLQENWAWYGGTWDTLSSLSLHSTMPKWFEILT